MAHFVFNAVTGVPIHEERFEIRAFRPILEWRKLIENFGFVDTMLYEIQAGDPTVDEMMCFVKPPLFSESKAETSGDELSMVNSWDSAGSFDNEDIFSSDVDHAMNHLIPSVPVMLPRVTALISKLPPLVMELAKSLVSSSISTDFYSIFY
jgi:hypothetical protein